MDRKPKSNPKFNTNFNPKFNTSFKPNPIYNKIHYRERKPNDDDVQKLFSLIEEGNQYKIKEFLQNNKLTTLVRTDNGETLLHTVISNSSLSKNIKFDLVQFLLDHNCPVSLANNLNVTPLHIACELQLKDIVELLISRGANVNAIDNQGMSPLHYQILSQTKACKTEKNTQINPIVPEKMNKMQLNKDFMKISAYILSIIYKNNNTNQYIKHIRNTIKNLHNMYPTDLYNEQNKYIIEFANQIIDPKIDENEKYTRALTSTKNLTNSIDELVTNNIKKTLIKMDIHPNSINGWGPDDNPMNKILPYKNINIILEKTDEEKLRNTNDAFNDLRKEIYKIDAEIKKLNGFFDGWKENILKIKGENNNQIPADRMSKIYSYDKIYQMQDFNIYHHTNNVDVFRYNNILIDRNDTNRGYYFFSNYKYFVNIINENITKIRRNVEILYQYINSDTVYFTYDILCFNIIVLIHNIILHIIILANESNRIQYKLSDFNIANEKYNQGTDIYLEILTLIDKINTEIDNSIKIIIQIYIILNKLVEYVNKILNIINSISAMRFIKQYHNNVTDTFFSKNKSEDLNALFDRSFQPFVLLPTTLRDYQEDIQLDITQTKEEVDNVKRKIWELYIPEITFMNFASFYTNGPGTLVKKGNTMNNLNISVRSLYNDQLTNVDNLRNPKIGFLIPGENINLIFDNTLPSLKYDNRNKYYTDDINNLQNGTIIGSLGVINTKKIDKEEAALASIENLLDEHLLIIKYMIIQHIISNVSKYINNNVGMPDYYRNFIQEIKNYMNKQKNILFVNDIDNSIIFTLIAQTIDMIIINFIKTCIREAAIDNTIKILKNKDNKNNNKFYTDIIADIIKNEKNLLLLNYESNYKLDLNEIIDAVITKFLDLHSNYNPVQLNYTALLLKENNNNINKINGINKDQHILYNYSFTTDIYENKCYNVDPDITELLIKNNAMINKKDYAGNTPAYYLVELQNLDIVQIFIKNNVSVNNSLSRNLIGVTPMIHALKLYQTHLEILGNPDNLMKELFDKITLNIKKRPEYQNNILEYSDNIFKEALLLINHQFYLLMKMYKGNWTYQKQKILLKYINFNLNDPNNKFIPLLQYDRSKVRLEGIRGAEVLEAKKEYINIKISSMNKNKLEIQEQIRNLQEEKNDIQSKIADKYYNERNIEIDNLLTSLDLDLRNINTYLQNQNVMFNKVFRSSNKISTNNSNILNSRATNFTLRDISDVVNLYDKIFKNVVNNQRNFKYTSGKDLITYLILWDNYIKNPAQQNNITQLHLSLVNYQYNIINNLFINKRFNANKLYKILGNINELSINIIKPFASNYDQLPVEYDKNVNYALSTVLDIITHVVRHNISALFYTATVKLLTKYVESMNNNYNNQSFNGKVFSDEQYSKYITGVVHNIISIGNIGNDESLLMKYIMETMPTKIVKIVLNIYENEYDPDRTISFDIMFENIINILTLNKTIPITQNSLIIEQLRSYIFPYFRYIYEVFVKGMKNMMDGYMRYIISESQQLEIIAVLLDKAVTETDPIKQI